MMKLNATLAALVLAACGIGHSQYASAQACTTPDGTLTTAAPVFNGNNCNHNLNFTKICANSETLGGGGMDVIELDLGTHTGVTLTLQSAAFTPELGVIGSPCSSSTTCIIDDTIAAPGTVGPDPLADNLPAGAYFVFVANVTDAACGAYALTVAGTLPVKLENFSVE